MVEVLSTCSVQGDPYNFTIDLTGEAVYDYELTFSPISQGVDQIVDLLKMLLGQM